MNSIRNFKDVLAELPEEEQRLIRQEADDAIFSIKLDQMRKARSVSQKSAANGFRVAQPAVAEKEKDMKISTLRNIVNDLGGLLKIQVEFPEGVSYALTR